MGYENNDKKQDSVYSKRIKAGKRRTYFFDVRATKGNDYFLTITESRKRFNDDGYDRHKIFLYKEDFHKFLRGLNEAVDFVKTDLMPDFDFDAFNHDEEDEYQPAVSQAITEPLEPSPNNGHSSDDAETLEDETRSIASTIVTNGNGTDHVDSW